VPGGFDHPPIVIEGSRVRAALLLVGSLAFVAGGLMLVTQAATPAAAAVPLVFFGACSVATLWMLARPPRMEIGPDGLVQRSFWRTEKLAWSDVQDFRPATLGIGTRAVGFDYAPGRRPRGPLDRLNLALTGVEGMLQPGYALEPHALADLLNQARERWLGENAASAADAAVPPVERGFAGARMNGKVFLIGWLCLVAAVTSISRAPGFEQPAFAMLLVFGAHLYALRLHDVGRSGWWQLGLYAAQAAMVGLAGAIGLDPMRFGLAFAAVVQLAFTAGLGALRGQPAANVFGPAPGQPSPLAQAEAFR